MYVKFIRRLIPSMCHFNNGIGCRRTGYVLKLLTTKLPMASQTISSTYFIIIDSKTFAAIGVIYYIGIMSVLCQLAWFLVNELCEVTSTWCMGRTPSLNEQLNIGLTFRKAENVSSTIIINSSGNLTSIPIQPLNGCIGIDVQLICFCIAIP